MVVWPKRVRQIALLTAAVGVMLLTAPAATWAAPAPQEILRSWYALVLKLVRHTPTYSPPVASRAFAYLGVTAFEAAASGQHSMRSLAGQLNALTPLPARQPGQTYDEATVMQAAMAAAAQDFFSNTGPTGQRALSALDLKLSAEVTAGLPLDVVAQSRAYGQAVAAHIIAWSQSDGGAVIENMGFPLSYTLPTGPSQWVPTSLIRQQQYPLLPEWGKNRGFAMPDSAACTLPPPPAYSEDKTSEFYQQALEVYKTRLSLTDEQIAIAKFWADDAMLSPTPPGHWISIALHILNGSDAPLDQTADVLARTGISAADAFIGCWRTKYTYNWVRPVTFIRRMIDAKWEPAISTPPFPEYPSGHSTESAAAATVLTQIYGDAYAFEDATPQADGLKPRHFSSFWDAAREAGISRLYGGIHFRAAIERGFDQGRCIGGFVNALKTRR